MAEGGGWGSAEKGGERHEGEGEESSSGGVGR